MRWIWTLSTRPIPNTATARCGKIGGSEIGRKVAGILVRVRVPDILCRCRIPIHHSVSAQLTCQTLTVTFVEIGMVAANQLHEQLARSVLRPTLTLCHTDEVIEPWHTANSAAEDKKASVPTVQRYRLSGRNDSADPQARSSGLRGSESQRAGS